MAMTEEHKVALEEGRAQSRRIGAYLASVEVQGRRTKRSPETLQKRLEAIEIKLETASPILRLQLFQERLDLKAELAELASNDGYKRLEADFVEVAQAYSARKGISYEAWREAGVPAATLKAARIPRS